MSDEWEDMGLDGSLGNMIPGSEVHNVRNRRTGEWRRVAVNSPDGIGDKIGKGEWYDEEGNSGE